MPYRNPRGEVKKGRQGVRRLLRTFTRFYTPFKRIVETKRLSGGKINAIQVAAARELFLK
jgi:hypothetical protein